ncbi:MAG: bifunctional hydroxymethylpyrimidine kinase/phosphomethylpyrimidine kinase, partial [Victivallaceae bacterium]
LKPDAIRSLKDKLLPLATWITPNIPEAEILTGIKIAGRETMLEAALQCSREWSCNCILKTGHMIAKGSNVADDVVCYDGKLYELSSPLITDCSASHGTGCTLSAALTAVLSLGFPWKEALMMAKGFVYGSLVESVTVGNDIDAMYPPMESYQGKTLLTRIEG